MTLTVPLKHLDCTFSTVVSLLCIWGLGFIAFEPNICQTTGLIFDSRTSWLIEEFLIDSITARSCGLKQAHITVTADSCYEVFGADVRGL